MDEHIENVENLETHAICIDLIIVATRIGFRSSAMGLETNQGKMDCHDHCYQRMGH